MIICINFVDSYALYDVVARLEDSTSYESIHCGSYVGKTHRSQIKSQALKRLEDYVAREPVCLFTHPALELTGCSGPSGMEVPDKTMISTQAHKTRHSGAAAIAQCRTAQRCGFLDGCGVRWRGVGDVQRRQSCLSLLVAQPRLSSMLRDQTAIDEYKWDGGGC